MMISVVENIEDENHTISNPIAEESASNTLEQNNKTKVPSKSALRKPASYLYTIKDGYKSLCVANIDSKSKLLACGFDKSTVQLWNLTPDFGAQKKVEVEVPSYGKYSSDDSKESQTSALKDRTISCQNPDKVLHGHNRSVFGLAFAQNNELLMSCSGDCTVRAWSLKTYETVYIYSDHKYSIWDIAVSFDSNYFATASMDLTACLWSFEHSTPVRVFVGHSRDVDCVKFHSNGQYIATASCDTTIRLWTVKDARSVRLLTGHATSISCIAFSPNGHHLASADDSGCIKIWDLGSGQEINEIQAHHNRILSMDYNRNGSLLATGGFDSFLKIWDVNFYTGEKKPQTGDLNGSNNFPSVGLIDSTCTDSVLHFLSFRRKDLIQSVATKCNRQN